MKTRFTSLNGALALTALAWFGESWRARLGNLLHEAKGKAGCNLSKRVYFQ